MRTLGGVPHSSIDIGDALADVAHRLGQNKVAAEVYQALLPVAHRLGQMRPNDVDAAKPEVVLHGNLTAVLLGPEPARDVERTTQDIALMRGLIDRFPKAPGLKEELAMDLARAAAAFVVAGDLAQAADSYRESIEMREDILRGDPHNTGLQRGLIVANGNYARVLGVPWSPNLGRFAEARVAGAKAVAIARAMVAADPKDANARFDLAMSLSRLGSIEPEPDGARDSLAFLQEAIALMEPTLKSNPKALGIVSQLAVAYDFAGHRLESLGNPEEAAKQSKLHRMWDGFSIPSTTRDGRVSPDKTWLCCTPPREIAHKPLIMPGELWPKRNAMPRRQVPTYAPPPGLDPISYWHRSIPGSANLQTPAAPPKKPLNCGVSSVTRESWPYIRRQLRKQVNCLRRLKRKIGPDLQVRALKIVVLTEVVWADNRELDIDLPHSIFQSRAWRQSAEHP